MYLFYVYVYVLYELFFIDNVVRLLFYVNMCACHVYFTRKTYLLTWASAHRGKWGQLTSLDEILKSENMQKRAVF